MRVKYPDIKPQKRTYRPAEYATKKFTSVAGTTSVRLYGSRPADATVFLTYTCSDAWVEAFLRSWHESKGGFYTLYLPEEVWAGMDTTLHQWMPSDLDWRWLERPRMESLQPDLSRVETRLIGTLEMG